MGMREIERKEGAVLSSVQTNDGVVPIEKERKERNENGMKGAVLSSVKNFGVVPLNLEGTGIGMKPSETETNQIETITQPEEENRVSTERERESNGAVLSRSMDIKSTENRGENKKRKACEEIETNETEIEKQAVKYIGETSRSGYERIKEHYKEFETISPRSHMLKHYFESHTNIDRKEMKFSVKVLRTYRSAFERQIGESVIINFNLKKGVHLLNS